MSDSESWTSELINEQLRKRFENHDTAKVTNLANQSSIATNMPPKTNIVFEGKAGDNFGGLNCSLKHLHCFSKQFKVPKFVWLRTGGEAR